MIPKNVRPGAEAFGLTGERQSFSIEANGKAFRTLIDGLYANSVQAIIRELCSNAADSHVEAGNPAPFLVQIPTSLDPTFRVRDFGTGLSHEDTMVLYTTIFKSTKEETNDQTGQLGLGSKSPFAYTDSFQVTVWDGAEARQYMTLLETDGIPSIVHMGNFPSDEPCGLEVQFAAKRGDIPQFQKEMQFVSLGYDHEVKPTVEGMTLRIPEPRMKGNGWAIYPRGAFGEELRHNHYIRQGSAVYPNNEIPFPHLGYGWISVVTVPIGTANVTASRDSLKYDADTRDAVSLVLRTAHEDLATQVQDVMDAAVTRIDKARAYAQLNGILQNLKGSTIVSLQPEGGEAYDSQNRLIDTPGTKLESAKFWGRGAQTRNAYDRWITGVDYQSIARLTLLVNDYEIRTVRRMKRIRNMSKRTGWAYVLDITDPKVRADALAHIVKVLELKPEQILLVSDLPDDPPAKSVRTGGGARRKLDGRYWMLRSGGRVRSEIFGESDRGLKEWPKQMVKAASEIGFILHWDDIFWVNESQQASFEKRGMLPVSSQLDMMLLAELRKRANQLPIDDAIVRQAIGQHVGEYNQALPIVVEQFFPKLPFPGTRDGLGAAAKVLAAAQMAQLDLHSRPITAKVEAEIKLLIQQFPLLFQRSDRSHYEQYVDAVRAATSNQQPALVA